MRMNAGLAVLLSAAVAVGMFWCPLSGVAAERDDSELDEVVVTGQKQETTLQDVDAAVTVLDAKTIDQAHIRDISQVDDVVPNVHFAQPGQLSNVFITIRGVESNPFIVNRAAVYIDGIPFRELTNAVLSQVESIEVLRGPQGTLYGANSESGLIVIRSRAPADSPEGEVRATGRQFSRTGGYALEGYYSQPVTDRLSASLAVQRSDESSWMRNRAPGVTEPGQISENFAHLRLRWEPTDTTTINTMAYVLDTKAPGVFVTDFIPQDKDVYDGLYSGFNGGKRSDRYSYFNDAPARTDETEYVFGTSLTQQVRGGAIDATLSYRKHESMSAGLDFDFTAMPTAAGRDSNFDDVLHGELRFATDRDRSLSFVVGTSYIRDEHDNEKATIVGAGTIDSYVAAPLQERMIESWSGFGVARWKPAFLSDFTLSAGLRYDRSTQSAIQRAGQLDLGGSIIYYTDARLRASDEAVLPRFSLTWEPTGNATFFASIAKGYIPGGFNLAATQEGISDPNILHYDKETMWSRELGLHLRSGDGKWRGSGAIFQIDSSNWQEIRVLTDPDGRITSSDFIGSSAKVRSRGFELEASWMPVRELTLTSSFGYADATYRYLFNGTENLAGNRVKLVPRYDANLSVRYQHHSGVFARAAANFVGKMALDEESHGMQKATSTFDLQLGYEKDVWSARLFAENITNARRVSGLAFDNLVFGRDGTVYGGFEAPRIIGVEIERRF
jgi:iron complex outermembrane recepter protein